MGGMRIVMARSGVSGVVFAIMLCVFLWYRGDLGAIDGPGGARLLPPTAAFASVDVAAAPLTSRAMGVLPAVTPPSAPPVAAFAADHVIAKPWRAPQGAGNIAQSAAGAIQAAERVGAISSSSGGAFRIELSGDYAVAWFSQRGAPVAWDDTISCAGGPPDRDRLAISASYAVACAIETLRASGQFEYVERDYIVRPAQSATTPPPVSDPLYAYQWSLGAQGDRGDAAPGAAGFSDFWVGQDQQGSTDVVVAVIDTGVDTAHPELRRSPNLLPGLDVVSSRDLSNDGDGRDRDARDPGEICPIEGLSSAPYHGTQVAGLIGAASANDRQGVTGAAWRVAVAPIRAAGACGGHMSDLADAIRWASGAEWIVVRGRRRPETLSNPNPAQIINISLGARTALGCPRTLQAAIDDARDAGAVVVAAAGNDAGDAAQYAPAACEGVLTVAASDVSGRLAPYSNAGADVDIMAPGGDVAQDFNADGQPDGILVITRARDCADPLTGEYVADCDYAFASGTSFAAAHVSAALAMLSAEYPAADAADLAGLVTNVARTPRTVADCPRACGSGLLNMGRAVRVRGDGGARSGG